MSGVDVLSVMKQLAGLAFVSGADEGPEGNEPAYRLHQNAISAIDAVEELIKADEELDASYSEFPPIGSEKSAIERAAVRVNEAKARHSRALAIVGGAA